uniref:PDZ domain protein n=1 Tax=Musca domestica TaxID=7370 RepID=T1PEE8_MUSDO
MVIDIKMCRFENVPWGFTLVGGADFEYPLTVVKVTEGSIAQEAGLKVGDVIVRINDTPTSPLTHEESHKVITKCGNVFFLGIKRENEEQHVKPNYFPTTNKAIPTTPTSFLDVTEQPRLPTSFVNVPAAAPTPAKPAVAESLPSERPPSPIPPLGTEPCLEAKSPVPHLSIENYTETFARGRSPSPITPTSFVAVVAVQSTVNMPKVRSPSPIPPLGTEPCLEAKSPGPYLMTEQAPESLTRARSPSPIPAIRTEPTWDSISLLPTTNAEQSLTNRRSQSPFTRQTLEYRPSTVFLQDPLEFRPSQSPIPFSPYLEAGETNESAEDNEQQNGGNQEAGNADDQYVGDQDDRPCSVLSEESERKLVEEEIAAVLADASEIAANELNHPGINIYRLYPKPGVCMSSQVLRTLSEEASKTKLEKEKENRRWTTFLQKPDRPIPKSKQQLEAERRAANAYKVKIVKSAPRSSRSVTPVPQPKPEPEKEPTPPPPVEEPQPEPEPEPEPEAPTPVDTEVPNLEETISKEDIANADESSSNQPEEEIEKSDKEKETTPEMKEMECPQEDNKANEPEAEEVSNVAEVEKTEEELALERQLVDVQRQLAALSNLPSTIQSTLDTVTRQLADLLPSFKLQQEKQKSPEAREISLERNDEPQHLTNEEDNADGKNTDIKANDNEADKCHESGEKDDGSNINALSQQQEQDNKANEQIANDTNEARDTIDKNPINQKEVTSTFSSGTVSEETQQMEDEQKLKKQKDHKHEVIGELEEHLERKSNPKRSKRAFGPLTPASDRPLVLPGGRRWYRPKDAYNDEFIAEILSAQAELITGSTLGVNFLKYQKPEKKIDLNRSEVYKVVHHLDRQPVRGIEVRAPVVPSEADIRAAAQSS